MERILEGLVWSRTLCKGNSIKKPLVLQYPSTEVAKNHWFYCIRPNKYQKTIGFTECVRKKYQKTSGFTDRATKNIEKPLVLQTGQPKTLKNHWFYCKTSPGQRGNRPCNRSGVWNWHTRLERLWGTLTAKLFREKTNHDLNSYFLWGCAVAFLVPA